MSEKPNSNAFSVIAIGEYNIEIKLGHNDHNEIFCVITTACMSTTMAKKLANQILEVLDNNNPPTTKHFHRR